MNRKLYLIAIVIVAIMLFLYGCSNSTNDPLIVPKPEETVPPIYETQCASVVFEALDGVAIDWADAYFTTSPVGGNPEFFVSQDNGLSFYAYEKLTQIYYKGALSLPDGYTDGNIVTGVRGAGSGEVSLIVLAHKDGKEQYIQYDMIGWYPECNSTFDAYLYFPDDSQYIKNIESQIEKQDAIKNKN